MRSSPTSPPRISGPLDSIQPGPLDRDAAVARRADTLPLGNPWSRHPVPSPTEPGARRGRSHEHHDVAGITGSAPGTADDERSVNLSSTPGHASGAPCGSATTSGDHEPCLPIPPEPRPRWPISSQPVPVPLPTTSQRPGHNGLDLSTAMFAPCLLGCPGTGRQNPAFPSLCLAELRYSSARRIVSVSRVLFSMRKSSGLLICWCRSVTGNPRSTPSLVMRINRGRSHQPHDSLSLSLSGDHADLAATTDAPQA